jgi:MFS family permease
MIRPVLRLHSLAQGPLAEREFRLLFLGRTTSLVGNAFANVALAFAVLDATGSKADLGFVLAARALPQLVFLLVGGVWADRLPRHLLMVACNIVSGASQAALAVLVLAGDAQIWQFIVLAAVNGASVAFFFPASAGIVPQTVPAPLLQQANTILRLGLNASSIAGAALGGIVVAVTNPGVGIAVDAASFFLAAALFALMRVRASERVQESSFTAELAEGWREFSSRTWLWAIVLQFGVVNAVESGSIYVLGPAVAKESLGGAAAWGLVLTALGLGLIAGGILLLRLRPRRILRAATLAMIVTVGLPAALSVPLPLPWIVGVALVAGMGLETFGILWDTALQQEIRGEALSRVSSYDALGSLALTPLGLAIAGPVAQAVGTQAALLGAAALSLAATLSVLCVRDVRTLPRRVRAS